MWDRGVLLGAAARLVRRVPFRWFVVVLAAGSAAGLVVASMALGDAPGPTLKVDQSFNSGQPVAPSFAPDGSGAAQGGVEFASAIQPDGKVIVVGQDSNGTVADFDVARYNANGTLDTGFGSSGLVQVAPTAGKLNFADAVAIDPSNGDVVIAGGDISGPDVPELLRLTPSGALDTSFGSNGSVVDSADAGSYLVGVVIDSSHRIVTIGSDGVVRRFTAAGAADSTFGSGGHTGALVSGPAVGSEVLALQPADGKILVAGTSGGAGTVDRLNTDGSLDPAFGTAGTATLAAGTAIRQMTLEGASIVVGGSDSSGNGMLARLTSTGTLDTTFGTASGYDTFAAPSGYSEHVDALFYDPGSPSGLIFCLYQTKTGSQTGGCSTLGVDGQTPGTPVPIQGTPKDGGYSFTPSSTLDWLSYEGDGEDTTGSGGTGPCPDISVSYSGDLQATTPHFYRGDFQVRPEGFYSLAVTSGALPPNLTMFNGIIVGTLAKPGVYTFGVTATDTTDPSCTGSTEVTITVVPSPTRISTDLYVRALKTPEQKRVGANATIPLNNSVGDYVDVYEGQSQTRVNDRGDVTLQVFRGEGCSGEPVLLSIGNTQETLPAKSSRSTDFILFFKTEQVPPGTYSVRATYSDPAGEYAQSTSCDEQFTIQPQPDTCPARRATDLAAWADPFASFAKEKEECADPVALGATGADSMVFITKKVFHGTTELTGTKEKRTVVADVKLDGKQVADLTFQIEISNKSQAEVTGLKFTDTLTDCFFPKAEKGGEPKPSVSGEGKGTPFEENDGHTQGVKEIKIPAGKSLKITIVCKAKPKEGAINKAALDGKGGTPHVEVKSVQYTVKEPRK